MFQTVRHWWTGGRGKVTARLFIFEFVVVMLGVLAAQGLQSWLAERGARREAQQLIDKAVDITRNMNRNVNYWALHGQCLRNHVEVIARNAVAGRAMSVDDIGRPGLPGVEPMGFTQAEWELIGNAAGKDRLEGFKNLDSNASNIKRYMADISDQWATLRLLDGSIGAPSPEDRSRVRLATAIIDNRLRWLLYNVGQFRRLAGMSGYTVNRELPESDSLVDDCGMLKDWR